MSRTLLPVRIVALALICFVIGGLAFVRLGSVADSLEVPDGAPAGHFESEPCEYQTASGPLAADCGTLVVPEHRDDPDSRLIALPVTRIAALSDEPAEPVFVLGGGPGTTNMDFPDADRLVDDHDVVLVGYRGVDGSSVLDCPEVTSVLRHAEDLADESSQQAYANAFRTCAARLTDEGVDLDGYSLTQRVDDLEAAREALGYEQVDVVSESAGTRTALVWSWRHPQRLHRSVMLGANPPGGFVWDSATTDEQVRRYADLCAKDSSCSRRTDHLAETFRAVRQDVPDRWGPFTIEQGNVRIGALHGLADSTPEAGSLSAPMTIDSWLAAREGDPRGLWLESLAADLFLPTSFVWGELAATASADADAARAYFARPPDPDAVLGDASTSFLWGGGGLIDAWPAPPDADAYDVMRTSQVETLVVSGELDVLTPPQHAARTLLPHLPNGTHVVLEGFGHTGDFWAHQPEAGARLITSFLATGTADTSLYEPNRIDFTPGLSPTELATLLALVLVGLTAVTVVSLLLMARRVSHRGRIGRRAGSVLRSVHALVLGLGGWFAGALVVLVAMPGVPLDDWLLAVVSVGVPVGLGVWLSCVDRADPGGRQAALLAAAAAGALLGAGLGHAAAPGVLALLTGVVGAVAGANLAVILLEVLRPAQVPLESRREVLRPVAVTR